MATYYGSWIATDDWRAVMDVTTSTSATSVSFTVVGKCQSVYAYSSYWQGTLTSNGSGGTNSTTFSCSTNQTVSFKTNTFSVSRGTSAKSVTVKCAVYNDNYGATSTATATITVPSLATYAITYNANGGSSTPATQTKYHGVAINLAAAISRANATQTLTVTYNANYTNGTAPSSSTATKTTSYSFSAWNTNSGGTGTSYAAGASYGDNAALTLYAQWTSTTTTTQVTLPTITRSGYTLDGWYTAASGGTLRGVAGAKYTPTAGETLYAHWTQATYTVTFNGNGATTHSKTSQACNVGSAVTLPTAAQCARTGYTLDGWYTAASGGTKAGNAGASYTPSGNVTLYAHWTAITYTVTYNTQGGSAVSSQTKAYGTSLKLAAAPTKANCAFLGWYTLANGSTSGGTAYAAGATYSANSNLALYAHWIGGTVKVSAARNATTPTQVDVSATWSCTSTVTGTVAVTATIGSTSITLSGTTSASKTQGTDLTGKTVTGTATLASASAATVTVTAKLTYSYAGTSGLTRSYSGTSYVGKEARAISVVHGSAVDGFEDGVAVGAIATAIGRFEVAMASVFSRAVTMATATVTGALSAASATISGALSAASATISGALTAGSATINGNTVVKGGRTIGRATNITSNTTTSSTTNSDAHHAFHDSAGTTVGIVGPQFNSSGGQMMVMYAQRVVNGSTVYNNLGAGINADGSRYYSISDPTAFRSAISAQAAGNYATYTSGMDAAVANNGGALQIWNLNATCVNTTNTTYNGHSIHLMVCNGGLQTYDSTSGSVVWLWNLSGWTSLYNNTSGSNGTITLSAAVTDFQYLDVWVVTNNKTCPQSVRIPVRAAATTSDVYHIEASANDAFIVRKVRYAISGKTMTPSYGNWMQDSSNTWSKGTGGTNYIYVTRVLGYMTV